MEDQSGTDKKIKVVPIGPGEAHLQNKVDVDHCGICKGDGVDMVLLRRGEKSMSMACTYHAGVTQEFIRQFGRMPLGWVKE
jgi:hypothetical protein